MRGAPAPAPAPAVRGTPASKGERPYQAEAADDVPIVIAPQEAAGAGAAAAAGSSAAAATAAGPGGSPRCSERGARRAMNLGTNQTSKHTPCT